MQFLHSCALAVFLKKISRHADRASRIPSATADAHVDCNGHYNNGTLLMLGMA